MDTWECERAKRIEKLQGNAQVFVVKVTEKLQKPHIVIDLGGDRAIDVVRAWVIAEGIGILNFAGTRESKCPRGL